MDNLLFGNVELTPHPTARSQARATRFIPAGSVVISVSAFAFALLEVEKGQRCDACFRKHNEDRRLRKCTGCASYYYCDADCQSMHWNMGHRRICRIYHKIDALLGFHQLALHERMDVLLLCHFLALIAPISATETQPSASGDPLSIFLSLLPGPGDLSRVLDLIPKSLNSREELSRDIYSRFHNNNFTVHSHMSTIGHGVFPLASRLFNHSCVPNAAPRYVLARAKPVTMEVVALRDVDVGEEVCVPYLDPALIQSRPQIFQYTYGFVCECNSCVIQRRLGQAPEPPHMDAMATISEALCSHVGIDNTLGESLPTPSLAELPVALHCVLHESYMERLSERFSKAAHEGEYEVAVRSGLTLLALYLVVYPKNYPQIGLHLLELAKTRWNAIISTEGTATTTEVKAEVRATLAHARKILVVYGREGDEIGPLDDIQKLEVLLDGV